MGVVDVQSSTSMPLGCPALVLLPLTSLAGWYLKYVNGSALEFGDRRARLRNDPRLQRFRFRCAEEVLIVPSEEQIVVVPPIHEPPRPRTNGMLAEVRGDMLGNDRSHGHREQLYECREWLLERDDDGAVLVHGDAGGV